MSDTILFSSYQFYCKLWCMYPTEKGRIVPLGYTKTPPELRWLKAELHSN